MDVGLLNLSCNGALTFRDAVKVDLVARTDGNSYNCLWTGLNTVNNSVYKMNSPLLGHGTVGFRTTNFTNHSVLPRRS